MISLCAIYVHGMRLSANTLIEATKPTVTAFHYGIIRLAPTRSDGSRLHKALESVHPQSFFLPERGRLMEIQLIPKDCFGYMGEPSTIIGCS